MCLAASAGQRLNWIGCRHPGALTIELPCVTTRPLDSLGTSNPEHECSCETCTLPATRSTAQQNSAEFLSPCSLHFWNSGIQVGVSFRRPEGSIQGFGYSAWFAFQRRVQDLSLSELRVVFTVLRFGSWKVVAFSFRASSVDDAKWILLMPSAHRTVPGLRFRQQMRNSLKSRSFQWLGVCGSLEGSSAFAFTLAAWQSLP